MSNLSDNAKVTILLCSSLALKDDVKPFTAIQWYNLSVKIYKSELKEPAALLGLSADELIAKLAISEADALRITVLLSRSINVAFELQKLESKGINVITKSDDDYPKRLIKVLGGRYAPPMLYYSGNLELAKNDCIGIVGSRNIDANGNAMCAEIAQKAALANITVVSGGARGVDSTSRTVALKNGGACIEFLADSMAKKIVQGEYIKPILQNRLLVFSVVSPNQGFLVYSAMDRNKYIYAMAKKTFAIAADLKRGGTWTGVMEALKRKWGYPYVWNTDIYRGNAELIKAGASPFSNVDELNFSNLDKEEAVNKLTMGNLFTEPYDTETYLVSDNSSEYSQKKVFTSDAIYKVALPIIKDFLKNEHTSKEIIEALNIVPKQAEEWLKKAVAEKQIIKLTRPVRYIATGDNQEQQCNFADSN